MARIILDYELSKELDKKVRFLWDRKCYQLIEGENETKWISMIPNSIPERYNPFDYYDPSGERHKDSLHLIFASIDFNDPLQIEKFCSEWGALGLYTHEYSAPYYLPQEIQSKIRPTDEGDQKETILFAPRLKGMNTAAIVGLSEVAFKFNISKEKVSRLENLEDLDIIPNVETSESIEDIAYEIEIFNKLISLREALKNKEYALIRKHLGINDDLTGEEIIDIGQTTISSFLFTMLEGKVSPIVKWIGRAPNLEWKCETLIESIYMMLLNDVIHDVNFKKCPHCFNWFSYTKKIPTYCSFTCQDNAKSARYKVNKKLEKQNGDSENG